MDPGLAGPIRDLLVDQKDDSGRVRTLRLVSGTPRPIDANAFRYALNRRLGWNTLKSNLYTIQHGETGPIFRGRGLGHGVGLCQAGADHMGQAGIGYERILSHYFPGTSIESADGGDRLRVLSSAHFELHFPAPEEPFVAGSLEYLEAERAKLGTRTRLLPSRISVRTHASTEEFIRTTGQPGWVSGSSDGRAIELQPLSVLESRGILRSTLHHELLHLVVHRLRARAVPDWYEEGMILHLTGEQVSLPQAIPAEASTAAASAKMETSYALARERVADLARRRGEDALWHVLEHPTPEDLRWFEAQR
jgi:stage II sporulation protein D